MDMKANKETIAMPEEGHDKPKREISSCVNDDELYSDHFDRFPGVSTGYGELRRKCHAAVTTADSYLLGYMLRLRKGR